MIVDPLVFAKLFEERLKKNGTYWKRHYLGDDIRRRRFRAYYGMEYEHCAVLWNKLHAVTADNLKGWKPKHLLDCLFFMKVYASEEVNAGIAGCDEKTVRKWNWKIIDEIANLDCVSH